MPPLCCILQITHKHKVLANTVNLQWRSCLSRILPKKFFQRFGVLLKQEWCRHCAVVAAAAASRKSGGVERKGWLAAPLCLTFRHSTAKPILALDKKFLLGKGGRYRSAQNPGITKIGITPLPPHSDTQTKFDIKSRVATGPISCSTYQPRYQPGGCPAKVHECDILTTTVRKLPRLGGADLITADCESTRCSVQGCCCLQRQGE